MLPSPKDRPWFPTHQQGQGQALREATGLFPPGPEMCVPTTEGTTPQHFLSIFLLALFFFPYPCFPFFYLFSSFAVSPEMFDLYFGCYPLLPLISKCCPRFQVFFSFPKSFLPFISLLLSPVSSAMLDQAHHPHFTLALKRAKCISFLEGQERLPGTPKPGG